MTSKSIFAKPKVSAKRKLLHYHMTVCNSRIQIESVHKNIWFVLSRMILLSVLPEIKQLKQRKYCFVSRKLSQVFGHASLIFTTQQRDCYKFTLRRNLQCLRRLTLLHSKLVRNSFAATFEENSSYSL